MARKSGTLQDLARAFEQPADRFVLNMIGDGPPLVLDPKQVEAARERIKTRYNVFVEQNLDEQPPAKPAVADRRPITDHASRLFFFSSHCSRLPLFWRGEEARPRCKRLPASIQGRGPGQGGLVSPGQRHRPAVRLLSTVAKEGAVLQARARRRSAARSRSRHGRSGREPKLRRAGTRRIRATRRRPTSSWSITKPTSP